MKYLLFFGFGIAGFSICNASVAWAEQSGVPAAASVNVSNLLLQKAEYWHAHQKMDRARQALTQAEQLSPNNPHILELKALWAHEEEDSAAVQVALKKLQRLFPNAPETQRIASRLAWPENTSEVDVSGARNLARSGETSAAAAAYRKLFPNGPPPSYAVEYYETMAGAVGLRDKGRLGLKQLIAQNPNNMDAQIAYAQVLTWRPATRADGLSRLEQLANIHGLNTAQSSSIEHAWSEALHWLAETPENVPSYDTWLKKHPADLDILAIRKRAEVAEPESASLSRTQGYQALANGGIVDADSFFSKAVAQRPSDTDALGGLGLVRMRQGRMKEAADLLERATQADPQNAGKWASALAAAQVSGAYGRVKSLIQSGDYAAAKGVIQKAIQLDPHQAGLFSLSGDVARKEGNVQEAEASYRQALAIEPSNVGALQGLYSLLRTSGRNEELADVEHRLTRLSPGFAKQIENADILRKAAATDSLDEKIDLLRRAVAETPRDPWTKLHLAQALVAAGNRAEAGQIMEPIMSAGKGASLATLQAGIYFANEIHDSATVERLMQILPRQGMTADIRQISERIKFQKMVDEAPDDPEEARLYFARIARQNDVDASGVRGELMARALLKRGDAAGAAGLLRDMLSRSIAPSAQQRITYAGVMIQAQEPVVARRIIAGLDALSLTYDERKSLQGLQSGLAIQASDQLNQKGKRAEAYDVLAPALKEGNAPAELALSRLYQSDHKAEKALSITRAILSQSPDDLDARLQAIRLCVELNNVGQAREDLDAMRERAPSDPRTWLAASVIAKATGNWSEALNALAQARTLRLESVGTSVEIEEGTNPFRKGVSQASATVTTDPMLASIDQEIETTGKAYAPYLNVGPLFNTRSGTGYSKLTDVEIPISGSLQVGPGRFNGSLTPVSLTGGKVPSAYSTQYAGNNTAGVALNAGYTWNWLQADVGTTPLGFATTNIVGGIQFYPQIADNLNLNIVLERRAMTDSVVAYSGLKNRETGQTWGGVMKNHAHAQLAFGGDGFNLYAGVGYAYLDGKNTRTNEQYEAGAGGSATLYKDNIHEVRIGSDLTWFRFDNNQYVFSDTAYYGLHSLVEGLRSLNSNFYNVDELVNGDSYGYGGYFSPQSFFAITFPVTYKGHLGDWTWDVGGQLGYQSYHSNSIGGLSTANNLNGNIGRLVGLDQNNIDLIKTSVTNSEWETNKSKSGLNEISSSGMIGGAHAHFFYQVTPFLRVGGNFDFQKAGPWNQFIAGISAHYTFLNSK
jgi:Tfp pilus assembly protein PilF